MLDDDKPPLIDWITLLVIAMLLLLVLFGMFLYRIRQQKDIKYYENYERSELVQPRIIYYPLESYSIVASISAYTMVETCPDGICITASGREAAKHIIACPRSIPLGSKVEIEGLGTFTCGDRTAEWIERKYGATFDLWFEDNYNRAREFGRVYKTVKVYQ
jgi:3D (Asp-Asp-Asp) domain-containing protein